MTNRYEGRGVSFSKKDVHDSIKHLDKGLIPGAFCKVIEDYLDGDPEYCSIMHADGAGTKSALAYLYWKETGDLSVWDGIAQDSIVMNLDDLICSGAKSIFLLSSTIGRNKHLIPKEVLARIINGTEKFIERMKGYGVTIISTGGETADIGDLVRTVVVDNTMVVREKRSNIIDNHNIAPGNVIVGLSSFGQTSYETQYNSGIGSNGLTSARHDIFSKEYQSVRESYDPETLPDLIYSGSKRLQDPIPEVKGMNFGKLVLSPTRTYAPVLRKIFEKYSQQIKGCIHCTGGGQTKILHFIKKNRIIKDQLFTPPPIFHYIQKENQTDWNEMYSVFNMGHRMELYVPKEIAEGIITIAAGFNLDAKIVGRVEESSEPQLQILDPTGMLQIYTP
jgi:phosphoribosylformylglycinamidine cyclo-ligase